MHWRTMTLGAAALLASATLALAQTTGIPPADPPPPAGIDASDIQQWVARYIRKGEDVEAAATDRMVLFYTPSSVSVTKPGAEVEAVVHGEQFVTQIIGPGPIRSFRDIWRFDCGARRFFMVESQIFPQSNLQGPPVRLDTSKERWSRSFQEGIGPGSLIAQVCRDAGLPVGGKEPPPRDTV